jgi:hypothetical protein
VGLYHVVMTANELEKIQRTAVAALIREHPRAFTLTELTDIAGAEQGTVHFALMCTERIGWIKETSGFWAACGGPEQFMSNAFDTLHTAVAVLVNDARLAGVSNALAPVASSVMGMVRK